MSIISTIFMAYVLALVVATATFIFGYPVKYLLNIEMNTHKYASVMIGVGSAVMITMLGILKGVIS